MIIGIFTDSYYPDVNGVSTASQTLVKSLIKKGHTVYVVTNTDKKKITIEDNIIRIPGIVAKKLYDYKFSNIFSYKVFNMLKKFKFDIIHIQTEVGIGIFGRILAKKWDIPLIYTYHTMYEDYTYYLTKKNPLFEKMTKKLLEYVTRVFIDSTTSITTTSAKAKNALINYGVKKYIHVVPNGVDFTEFDSNKFSKEDFENFRKENDLENKKILLYLGRVAQEKSIDKILIGFKKYLQKEDSNKDMVLLVVGDGPYLETLKQNCTMLELDQYVRFIGKVEHSKVPFFYSLSDLFISASTSETQGLTYSEAMSCNCMVLCAFDYNLKEVVIDNRTGFYFYDDESFVNRLAFILNMSDTEKNKIIAAAKENNDQLFSIDKYAERMEKVYEKAIREHW